MRTSTLRQIRSELLALVASIDEALRDDTVDRVVDAFPGATEVVFDSSRELMGHAVAAGIDPQRVKAVAAEILGPPTGEPRTKDELARVWRALTLPGGES